MTQSDPNAPGARPEKQHFFDKPRNVRAVLGVFFVIAIITLGIDLGFDRHTDHPYERRVGFYGIWGFVSCVVLVLAARGLRRLIMRGEDHYGD